MSYRLQYGACRFDKKKLSKQKIALFLAGGLVVAVLLLCVGYPSQAAAIRSHMFPFLEPNVQEAFYAMQESVRQGSDLKEAAVVFCRDVIHDAIG